MAFVKVRKGESIDSAIKRFSRKVEEEGIIFEHRKKMYFTKPSLIKREKKNKILFKIKQKELKEKLESKKKFNYK